MELKIIYMTNHDRRYAAMRKACGELQEEGRISDLCIPVLAERSSDWNASWERKFTGASLVMIHFMKNASKSPFWKACRSFLEAHGIPYFLDSVEGDAAEHSTAIETSVLHQFRLYFLYGGNTNYRNVWLYATALCAPGTAQPEAPKPFAWAGIYDPEQEERYTTDAEAYRAAHCAADKPVVGLLFYRDEWIWGDLSYQDALIRALQARGCQVLPVFANSFLDTSAGMPSLSDVFDQYFSIRANRYRMS